MTVDQSFNIFLNTHSSVADLWPMFFGQLAKHWPGHPPVVLSSDYNFMSAKFQEQPCVPHNAPDGLRQVAYHESDSFGQQYLQGLSHVQTDYVLPLLEDIILMGPVDEAAMAEAARFCATHAPVRLVKTNSKEPKGMAIRDTGMFSLCEGKFTMQPTVRDTSELLRRCVDLRHIATPREWEPAGGFIEVCLEPTENGPQRGRVHWDSLIFPAICTALNKGRWNTEYRAELEPLFAEYGIDPNKRGWM